MDQLLVTVLSGVSNGAVYGLVGLGLVIIFQSTDVMNFAMAAMATTAGYVALSMVDAGVALALALMIAVAFASLFGLAVREVLIRPLGEGRLFAALVVTMGVAIGTEHFVRVVDHHAGRLGARATGRGTDVVEQGEESCGHQAISLTSVTRAAYRPVSRRRGRGGGTPRRTSPAA